MSRANHLVGLTSSATALEAALTVADLKDSALDNHALPHHLWMSQYTGRPKPTAKRAGMLAERRLTAEQMDTIIGTETKATVVQKAFKVNRPTLQQLNDLLESKALTAAVANTIVETFPDVVDVAWLHAAGQKVGQKARMEYYLRAPEATSDAELIAALEDYASWCADWDTDRQHRLLASRPSVLPGAVRSNSLKLRTSAAGCRFLTDPAMQRQLADLDTPEAKDPKAAPAAWLNDRAFVWTALVCNPTCDIEVVRELEPIMSSLEDYETRYRATNRLQRQPFRVSGRFQDVDDHTTLAWLLRRTLPGASKNAGRPYDLPALMENPHLTAAEATEIFGSLASTPETVTEPGVRDSLLELIKRFPVEARTAEMAAEEVFDIFEGQFEAERNRIANHGREALGDLPEEVSEEQALSVADHTVRSLSWNSTAFERAVKYLDLHIEDSIPAWMVTFRLLDQGDFAGSVADLATVANATA